MVKSKLLYYIGYILGISPKNSEDTNGLSTNASEIVDQGSENFLGPIDIGDACRYKHNPQDIYSCLQPEAKPSSGKKSVSFNEIAQIRIFDQYESSSHLLHVEDDFSACKCTELGSDQDLLLEAITNDKNFDSANFDLYYKRIHVSNIRYDEDVSRKMKALIAAHNGQNTLPNCASLLGKWMKHASNIVNQTGPLIRDLCAAAKGRNSVFKYVLGMINCSSKIVGICLSHNVDKDTLGSSLGEILVENYAKKNCLWLDIAATLEVLILYKELTFDQLALKDGASLSDIFEILRKFAATTKRTQLRDAISLYISRNYSL